MKCSKESTARSRGHAYNDKYEALVLSLHRLWGRVRRSASGGRIYRPCASKYQRDNSFKMWHSAHVPQTIRRPSNGIYYVEQHRTRVQHEAAEQQVVGRTVCQWHNQEVGKLSLAVGHWAGMHGNLNVCV
jgi:hypothetical protein